MLSGSIRFLRESGAIGKLDKLTAVLSDNSSLTFSPSACISSLSLLNNSSRSRSSFITRVPGRSQ